MLARLEFSHPANPVSAPSVDEWWNRWFPALDLAPATLETYAQQYRRHVRARFGDRPLAEVIGLDLTGFARTLREQGLAPSTVTVVMTVMRDLLTDAASEGLIAAVPIHHERHRQTARGVRSRVGVAVGMETALAICDRLPAQEAMVILVAAFTGMRLGEVCGMRRSMLHVPGSAEDKPSRGPVNDAPWYAVDPMVGAVHEDVHAHRFFAPAKGGYGRVIDLPPFLAELLTGYCRRFGQRDLLFVNRHGDPIRRTDFMYRWRPACDGILARYGRDGRLLKPARPPICPGLRFHDLRHTHKTILTELGVPEVLQDERLGHHQPAMRAVYAHVSPVMRRKMLDRLEDLWCGCRPFGLRGSRI